MSDPAVTCSIIIPVKPGGQVAALAPLRRLAYPATDCEVLIAEGRRPSLQRNRAAAAAAGELLYFLDDDSLVSPDALTLLADVLRDPPVAVVGGPSLTPETDSPFQRTVGFALQSPLGGGGVRNRYRAVGSRRVTNERELILCNLCFRRSDFLANGGLDERLYPNEENELLDRLQATGHTLVHDPQLAVRRSQRSTVRAFIRQMYGYGVGRGEQNRIMGRWRIDAVIPPLFLLYTLMLLFVPFWWFRLPGALYLLLLAATALQAQLTQPIPGIGWRLFGVIPALHLLYGAGIIAGTVAPRFRERGAEECLVTIRHEKRLGEPWDAEGPERDGV